MDIVKFHPDNIRYLQHSDLISLTKDEIKELSEVYPFMEGRLQIVKEGTVKPKSVATYRSLWSLLKGGHKFNIVGSIYEEPLLQVDKQVVAEMQEVEFIQPEQPIFNNKQKTNEYKQNPAKSRNRRGNN
jgi:hypothetical protein